jgi:hypothetical protein
MNQTVATLLFAGTSQLSLHSILLARPYSVNNCTRFCSRDFHSHQWEIKVLANPDLIGCTAINLLSSLVNYAS